MLLRIITSILGIPIIVFFLIFGGIPMKIILTFVIIIALDEFYKAFSKKRNLLYFTGYIFSVIFMFFLQNNPASNETKIIVLTFILSILSISVIRYDKINLVDTVVTIIGFFYITFLFSTIYSVRVHQHGEFFAWLIFISAFGSDTGAYFAGITLGKHKLAPSLSPKKTVEGSIGGIVLASLLSLIYGFIISKYYVFEDINIVLFTTLIGAVGAVFAQLGDLIASAVKRFANIKDFGKILPGHGGIMDRFDSVLFTSPAIYVFMTLLFKFLSKR